MTLGFFLLLQTQLFCFLHVSPASSVNTAASLHGLSCIRRTIAPMALEMFVLLSYKDIMLTESKRFLSFTLNVFSKLFQVEVNRNLIFLLFQISSSTYKDRNEEYKQQFTHLPDSEKLIAGTQSPPNAEKRNKRPFGEIARASCGRDYLKEMSHHYL